MTKAWNDIDPSQHHRSNAIHQSIATAITLDPAMPLIIPPSTSIHLLLWADMAEGKHEPMMPSQLQQTGDEYHLF
jgi:hypothetical protein